MRVSIRTNNDSGLRNSHESMMTTRSRNSLYLTMLLSEDNSKIWIGNLVREGETLYSQWKKNQQSMSYLFRQECDTLFSDNKIDDVFDCSKVTLFSSRNT